LLKNLGLQAKQLRLPSNIPIAPNNADTWLWESLLAQGISIDRDTRNQYLVLGIFGSIYPEWPTQEFCTKIKLLARAQKKTCLLLSIGHIGAGTATWDALCKEADEQLSAISLGRLDSKKISEVLQSLDLGVATLPWELIEKGSSVATLLAHGLPVLVPRDDIHFPFSSQDPQENQLIKLSIPIPDILTRTSKTPPHDSLKLIALQFLADLNA
jgi:hypothetical protein